MHRVKLTSAMEKKIQKGEFPITFVIAKSQVNPNKGLTIPVKLSKNQLTELNLNGKTSIQITKKQANAKSAGFLFLIPLIAGLASAAVSVGVPLAVQAGVENANKLDPAKVRERVQQKLKSYVKMKVADNGGQVPSDVMDKDTMTDISNQFTQDAIEELTREKSIRGKGIRKAAIKPSMDIYSGAGMKFPMFIKFNKTQLKKLKSAHKNKKPITLTITKTQRSITAGEGYHAVPLTKTEYNKCMKSNGSVKLGFSHRKRGGFLDSLWQTLGNLGTKIGNSASNIASKIGSYGSKIGNRLSTSGNNFGNKLATAGNSAMSKLGKYGDQLGAYTKKVIKEAPAYYEKAKPYVDKIKPIAEPLLQQLLKKNEQGKLSEEDRKILTDILIKQHEMNSKLDIQAMVNEQKMPKPKKINLDELKTPDDAGKGLFMPARGLKMPSAKGMIRYKFKKAKK